VWSAAPASAGKPPTVVSTSFAPNGDCSIDFAIELNSKGRMPNVIVVHYWQAGTHAGSSYRSLANIQRGERRQGNVSFSAADPSFGSIYDIGYTAFARNGSIIAAAKIGAVDVAACLAG
ncbi:MAG TPA: hypothetical protein VK960_06040, partial [Acidimicrobiia bacterium]|nr:hypothetical protein [Acidimicrobiia bacterium]